MLAILSRYGLAVHLALLAVAPLFLTPITTLFLSFSAGVWMILEPSRIGSESLHDARRRVYGRFMTDPLFWILLALVVIAALRAFNTGIEMAYDAETMKWSISDPLWPILPASMNQSGFVNFVMVVVLLLVLVSARHALGRSARFSFLIVSSCFAAVGALVFAFLIRSGNERLILEAKTDLANPSFLGPAFGLYLMAAIQGLASTFERRWRGAIILSIIGIAGTALGLFFFSPPLVVAIFIGAALLLFIANFTVIRLNLGNPTEFKYLVIFGISLTIAVLVVLSLMPKDILSLKLAPYLDEAKFLPDQWRAQFPLLSGISRKIWISAPWLGGGLGSFSLNLSFAATPADWEAISPVQSAPLSGYWMLLAERGALGAFVFAVVLIFLLVTFARNLWTGRSHIPHPIVLMGPLALVASLVEMVGDVSILRPGTLVVLTALLALSAHGFVKENSHGR